MNREEMLLELRNVVNDDHLHGVWHRDTLLRRLSEGQDKFCEEAGYFTDLTSFTLTLLANTANYAIPARVIQVLDIWDGSRRLGKRNEAERKGMEHDRYPVNVAERTGRPTQWQTDQATGIISLHPVPTAAEAGVILQLRVWRYSLIELNATVAEPEIPGRFHWACIEWAAGKCFSDHDMEAQDPVKAQEHFNNFFRYIRDGRQALRRLQNQEVSIGFDAAYRT